MATARKSKRRTSKIECYACFKTFSTKTQIEHHMNNLSINVTTKCRECKKSSCHHAAYCKTFHCGYCLDKVVEPYHLHVCFHVNEVKNEHVSSDLDDSDQCIYCDKIMPSTNLASHEAWHRKHDKNVKRLTETKTPRMTSDVQGLCSYCGVTKPGNKLRRHEYVEHVKKYIRKVCDICGIFTCPTYIKEHMRTHDAEKGFTCSECGKAFFRKKALARHKLVHTDVAQYMCTVCGKSFKIKFNLRVHMRTHDSVKPFSCSVCRKTFTTKQWRNNHLRTHGIVNRKLLTACSVCLQTFSSEDLSNHLNSVLQKADIVLKHDTICPTCLEPVDKDFAKKHLCFHETSTATGEDTDICIFCSQVIPLSELKDHEYDHREREKARLRQRRRPVKEGATKCAQCGVTVSWKDAKRHERTHRRLRPTVCDICGFVTRNIYQHMSSHSGERNFACQECGMAFKRKKNLDTHMLVHEPVGKHSCCTCGKVFKSSYNLKVHLRSHQVVKPFKCEYCVKTFTTKQSRDNHLRTHMR